MDLVCLNSCCSCFSDVNPVINISAEIIYLDDKMETVSMIRYYFVYLEDGIFTEISMLNPCIPSFCTVPVGLLYVLTLILMKSYGLYHTVS